MEEIWKDINGYEGLYQVSNTGNVKLRDIKYGEESFWHKLTKIQVGIIRDALKEGYYQRDIARYFNVSQTNISSIKRGATWSC